MSRHKLVQRFGLGLAAATAFIWPAGVNGQQGRDLMTDRPAEKRNIVLTGDLGMYLPLGSLVQDSTVRLRGVGTIKFGTRLTVPVRSGFALESSLGWSPSLVAQSDWKETVDLEGGVWLASVRGRMRMYRDATGGTEVFFAPGVGLVHRYGRAWDQMTGKTDAALVLGTSVRYEIPGTRGAFLLSLEDFITRTGFTDQSGLRYGGRLHNEIVFAVGAAIDVARR
jgi:hypothetical protein